MPNGTRTGPKESARATRSKWSLIGRRMCRTRFVARCCWASWCRSKALQGNRRERRNRCVEPTLAYASWSDDRQFRFGRRPRTVPPGVEPCRQVLLDFSEVGVRAIDDRTLEIRLENPTPYFLELLSFYPLAPVHRGCLRTLRLAGLEKAGEYCHQRRVSTRRASHSRPNPAREEAKRIGIARTSRST